MFCLYHLQYFSLRLEEQFFATQTLQSIWAIFLEMTSVINMQGFSGIRLILIIECCQFTTQFLRQNHFFGMCELPNEKFAHATLHFIIILR